MATISLIDPYSQQAEEIARRKRMAQALQESGSQVLDMPTMPGVAISPYAGLAKVLESGLGAYQEAKAQKDYAALQDKYRTNYNTQLGEMARLISAPEVKGVAGTSEIPYEPAQTEKIYGTKPAPVMGSGYGSGMLMPDQVIGEKVIKPEVPYQAAVAPVEARPAGYISAADLQKIDIPEVKQLLMAKYLKQFEPEQLTLGENQRLLRRVGGGDFKEVVGVSKTPTAATPTDLARLLAERAAIAAKNPTDPNLATYDSAIEKLTQDKNLAFQREKFEYETANPGYSYERITNPDGSETIQAINKASGVARPVRTGTGQVLTSAAQEKTPIYSDVVRNGKIYKMDLNKPESKDNLIFVKEQSPDLMEVKTTKDGKNVTIYVNKSELKGIEYPEQYSGIIRDLLQAQDIMKYQKDPNVIALVGAALNKGAGLPTQEDVANYLLQLQKAKAELSYSNIPLGNIGPPLQAAPNVLTGQYSSGSGAPAAAVDNKNKWLKN